MLSCQTRMDAFARASLLASHAIGVPALDQELAALGKELRAARQKELGTPAPTSFPGPDVYLATHLPSPGGHSLLLGDFVAALSETGGGQTPHVFLTNLNLYPGGAIAEPLVDSLGIPPDRLHVLTETSPGAKLEHLLDALTEIRPTRLFLFHLPGDPIPVAAAAAGLAGKLYLAHHADARPCLGLHLDGMLALELHPFGAASSRVLGIPHEMLPLTAPDPGPRPAGFLRRGTLTTAACGRKSKFRLDSQPSYPQAVLTILQSTQGRHAHFGPLLDEVLGEIHRLLRAHSIPADHFIHVPWVPSLGQALWDHGCDVYLSSFPVDGARANAEVAASGTPFLKRVSPARAGEAPDPFQPAGALYWSTLEELAARLAECRDMEFLAEKSRVIRAHYERLHHPRVFRETLQRILDGGSGINDSQVEKRQVLRMSKMIRSLAEAEFRRTETEMAREQQWRAEAAKLAERCTKLHLRLKKLEEERKLLFPKGTGWRARFRRWLFKA